MIRAGVDIGKRTGDRSFEPIQSERLAIVTSSALHFGFEFERNLALPL